MASSNGVAPEGGPSRRGEEEELRAAILDVARNNKIAGELRKDLHLVLASLETDRVIMTLDHKGRQGFGDLGDRFKLIQRARWLDPSKKYDEVDRWLKGRR
jgi:hypothetical protein